ncbi:MAG: hypothetical protein ACNA7Y_04165 [Gammaproteobacteria bacterium]
MKYPATISYIVFIIFVNILYARLPHMNVGGHLIFIGDILIGFIYLFRDFAQREIKHYVLVAMLIGAGLSYVLATPGIAIASVTAFTIGETIEWIIFTWTRKPLSQRLLWSACISVPVDSAVFLYMINRLYITDFSIQTASKIVGVLLLWYLWRRRQFLNF